jgi:hypothetical protein
MKTRLEQLFTDDINDVCYVTSIEDCEEWFHILNEEIFDCKLPVIDYVDIRWRRKAWAYYQYITDNNDADYKESVLCMNKKYTNKKFFVEVLAHELIHHHQFIFDEPMGHGPSFMKWMKAFNQKGLKLVKSYGSKRDEE